MKKSTVSLASAVVVASLAGCATEDPGAGSEFDQTSDEGAKEDSATAGISENTFDAFGVLNAAASLTAQDMKLKLGIPLSKGRKLEAFQKGNNEAFGDWDDRPFITVWRMARTGDLT